MIFFGTQPTFTQVPPRGPDSISATRAPYSAARCAAASPPLPPPIATKSNFSLIDPRDRLAAMLYEVRPARVPERGVRAAAGAATMTPFRRSGNACKTLYSARSRCHSSSRSVRSTWSRRCGSCCRRTGRASRNWPPRSSRPSPRWGADGGRRISRAWSPVSHLNAVLNRTRRASYNAAPAPVRVPDRSGAEQRCYAPSYAGRRARRRAARRSGGCWLRARLRLAGGLPAAQGRFKTAMLSHAAAGRSSRRTLMRPTAGCQRHEAAQLAGLNQMLIEQARRRG
jgi:hypothetical protein